MIDLTAMNADRLANELVSTGALLAEIRAGEPVSVMIGKPPHEKLVELTASGQAVISGMLDKALARRLDAIRDEMELRRSAAKEGA